MRKREPPTNKKGEENLFLEGRDKKSRDRNRFFAMISKQVHNQVVLVLKIRPTQTAPSRKKMVDFSSESSDDESSFQTGESEGYRMVDLEKLSKAVSSAHVCNKGEKLCR